MDVPKKSKRLIIWNGGSIYKQADVAKITKIMKENGKW